MARQEDSNKAVNDQIRELERMKEWPEMPGVTEGGDAPSMLAPQMTPEQVAAQSMRQDEAQAPEVSIAGGESDDEQGNTLKDILRELRDISETLSAIHDEIISED